MRVTYLGHACFLLASENFSVAIDPFCDIGYDLKRVNCDYVLCSHSHFDHNAVDCVNANAVISDNLYHNYPWLKVINSYHDNENGARRGKNNIFMLELDGVKICHLGDLGQAFNKQLCAKIGKIDLLLIPVGGNYTIDAKTAYEYVKEIKPSAVIPMHYKTKRSNIDIALKEDFLKLFDKVIKEKSSFEYTLSNGLTVYDLDDSEF